MGVYQDSIVIDACAPPCRANNCHVKYVQGGITAACGTISPVGGHLAETITGISYYYDLFRRDPNVMQILTVDDIYRAKAEKKLGIIMSFQGTSHLQGELSLIEVYYRLGIRQMLLCHNTRNEIGDGCTEPQDGGLSVFGEKAIQEMNRLGVLVDLAHTGYRTTMEAMEASKKPVVFSHGNPYGMYPSQRNLKDEQAIKCAKMGGTIGLTAVPYFLSDNPRPKINLFIDHIDYYVNLVGIDHVALGIDYFMYHHGFCDEQTAVNFYNSMIEKGIWSKDTYPPPPTYYVEEIMTPDLLPNLGPALQARGYADSDIKKILGENYLRVLKEVWK